MFSLSLSRGVDTYFRYSYVDNPSFEVRLVLHTHVFDVFRAFLLNQWMLKGRVNRWKARHRLTWLTFSAKQNSLGDLNFFFQSRPKKSSTFSNFAKQTKSFWTEEKKDDGWRRKGICLYFAFAFGKEVEARRSKNTEMFLPRFTRFLLQIDRPFGVRGGEKSVLRCYRAEQRILLRSFREIQSIGRNRWPHENRLGQLLVVFEDPF